MSASGFIPDDPQDTSLMIPGKFYDGIEEYRCARVRARHPTPEAQYHFYSTHLGYQEYIERHGPKIYGTNRLQQCAYVEYIEGTPLDRFLTTDINPWTAAGSMMLARVATNIVNIMESLWRDEYTAETLTLAGYIVKADLSVRQVDWNWFDWHGRNRRRGQLYQRALESLKENVMEALENNIDNRRQTLSNAEFQAQLDSVPGMTDHLFY